MPSDHSLFHPEMVSRGGSQLDKPVNGKGSILHCPPPRGLCMCSLLSFAMPSRRQSGGGQQGTINEGVAAHLHRKLFCL